MERFYNLVNYVSKVACGRCAMKIATKMEKKKRPTHPHSSFAIGLVYSAFQEMPRGILVLRLLECMDFVALCFHLESCSVKVCLNWRWKVNWTFWYQIWVDRGWLWKKLPPKARSAWMPVQTIALLQYDDIIECLVYETMTMWCLWVTPHSTGSAPSPGLFLDFTYTRRTTNLDYAYAWYA